MDTEAAPTNMSSSVGTENASSDRPRPSVEADNDMGLEQNIDSDREKYLVPTGPLRTPQLKSSDVQGNTSKSNTNHDDVTENSAESVTLLNRNNTNSVAGDHDVEGAQTLDEETGKPVNWKDEHGNTLLHLAAMSGLEGRVKYLINKGADLLLKNEDKQTALHMILNNMQNGEDLLIGILDDNVRIVEKGKLEVSLKLLRPENRNPMAVADKLYTDHTDKKNLLRHPVLMALIQSKWKTYKYFMWYRAFIFLLYLLLLTLFVFCREEEYGAIVRYSLFPISVHLIIFCFPYVIPGHYTWCQRIIKILLLAVPPLLTIVSMSIPYNAEWFASSYLFSWLSIPMYCTPFKTISHQAGMFIFVTREVIKHSVLFFLVLAGFSMTFYVLYHDIGPKYYKNYWHTFLYTTLVLLQGDHLADYRDIKRNSTVDTTVSNRYMTYATHTLSKKRFASIITSLLFVLLVIIALLNMLIALAIRGGNELEEYGQIYHMWNRTELLYDWYNVKVRIFSSVFRTTHEGDETITDTNIPRSVRNELLYLAKKKMLKK